MFKAIKIYVGETADPSGISATLLEFSYKHQQSVQQEGDFSRRGGILDVFPSTFDLPIRIEFDADTVISIKSYDPVKVLPFGSTG